jgi:hypothetical protein
MLDPVNKKKEQINGFQFVGALTCVEPGVVGVLDSKGIHRYELATKTKTCIRLHDKGFQCRGLALTPNKEFVTVAKCRGEVKICIVASDGASMTIENYPIQANTTNPCFMDMNGSRLCITDLGTNSFTLYDYHSENGKPSLKNGRVVHTLSEFISGVRLDKNNEMLIGDAARHSLSWYDEKGELKRAIHFEPKAFPYVSGFAVSPDGKLMACDRHGSISLFQLTSKQL